jgi:hypothetical protein
MPQETQDQTEIQFDRKRNGSLYDRGGADFWYARPRNPHWYPDGSYKGEPVTRTELTPAEVAEYNAGYDVAEKQGDQKEW